MKFIQTIVWLLLTVTVSKAQITVLGKVDHIEPDGVDSLGGISLTVSGSTAPYTYTWTPGTYTTQNISNQAAGQYILNVRSASSQTYTTRYNIGYKVKWAGLERCTFSNDSLVSTTASGLNHSKAVSKNLLASGENGWFEYVVSSIAGITNIGFCDSVTPLINKASDIDFGFYCYTNLAVSAVENGNVYSLTTNPKVGYVLRLERNGNVITYKINGTAVRTTTVSGVSSKNFRLKAMMNGTEKILNAGCSFMPKGNSYFANFAIGTPLITHATGSLTADGSIKYNPGISGSHTYSWSTGATTNSVTGLDAGQYKLNVENADTMRFSKYYHIGYKSQWTNLDLCRFRNDSLTSLSNSASIFSRAVSKNTLPSGTDGWFEFVLASTTTKEGYIGFLDSISPIGGAFSDIDYGFKLEDDRTFSYYENGVATYTAPQRAGDLVRVERVGNTINYKINGVTIKSTTVSGLSAKNLKIKVALAYPLSISNIGCSFLPWGNITFPNYVSATALIQHNTSFGSNDGSVMVTPRIAFSNTYSWTPGGATTNSVTSLSPGLYKVTVKDSLLNASSHYYNVGYRVKWTNLNQLEYRNDSLISNAIANRFSKACSKNTLRSGENGWFEMMVNQKTYDFYTGFSDSLSLNVYTFSWQDIDNGFFYNSAENSLYSYEKGTLTKVYSQVSIGDLLKVERINNTIYYRVNGATVRSVTVSGLSSRSFKLKVHLEYTCKMKNIGCSFYKTDSSEVKNYVEIVPLIKHSSGVGINDGSISVTPRLSGLQSYSWQPSGVTTATNNSLFNGIYTVTVTDSSANKSNYQYNVGYKTKWTNVSGGFFRNDTLKAVTTTTLYNYARTANVLATNEDGWFEYVVPVISSYRHYIGFADSSANNASIFTDIQYGMYSLGTSLYYYEGGTSDVVYGYIKAGDVIRVERAGNTIRYKINSEIIRTVTNVAIGPKVFRIKAKLGYQNYLTHVGSSFTPCTFTMSAGSTQTITCSTPSVVLTGTTNLSGASYIWSPSSITTSTASVASPGTYTLAVSSSSGQCVGQSTVVVVEPFSTFANITNYENDTIPGEVELCVKGAILPYNIVWNGQRVPSYDTVYSMIIASGVTLPIDTVRLKHDLDSIRAVTKHKQLDPGLYPVTVYNAANDSLKAINIVGGKITWALSKGINFTSTQIPEFETGGKRYLYGSGENLSQSGTYYLGQSTAYAANIISKDYNNSIQFRIPNVSDSIDVGLAFRKAQMDSIPNDSVMLARMSFHGADIKVKYEGSVIYTGSRISGDVFTIANDTASGKIRFYKNNTLLVVKDFIDIFRGADAPESDVLLLGITMAKAGATLNNLLIISNPKYLQNRVEGTITDATCGNLCSGTIDAKGISVDNVVPSKYEIIDVATNTVFNTITYTSGPNHALFTGLCAGKYKIKYYAEKSQYTFGGTPVTSTVIYQKTFEVAYMPDWVNNTGVTIGSDKSLTKSAGAIYNWDAGASSLNTLLAGQSGWIEWSPSLETEINGIGFSTSDADLDIATINYGIGYIRIDLGLWGTWRYYVKTNNNTMIGSINSPNNNVLQPYNQKDKFRLEKNGSNISLSLNGAPINQFTGVSTTTPFILDASLKFFGGTILHPRVSFGCPEVAKQYAVLKTSMDGHYYELSGNNLRFTLDGEYTLNYLKYRVLDNKQVVVASDYYNTSLLSPANVKPGDNRYSLNCNSLPAGYYTLEVINEKNEKQYLRFKR